LRYYCADIRDPKTLPPALAECEVVYHLAAVASDWAPRDLVFAVNTEGTRNLLRMSRNAGVRRFVLMSTLAVHAPRGYRNGDERAPRDRDDMAYAVSKRLAEDLIFDPRLDGRIETVCIRPGLVPYGPHDHTSFDKLATALRNRTMAFVGNGETLTCTVYAENLAHGALLAGTHPAAPGNIFVITDDRTITWRTLFDLFADAVCAPPVRFKVPYPLARTAAAALEAVYSVLRIKQSPPLTRYRASLMARDYHFSCEKARRLLGYHPPVSLEEGVRRTGRWFLEQTTP
jgi:hypothetical protein